MKYAFQLGHEPLLSLLELQAVFLQTPDVYLHKTDAIAYCELEAPQVEKFSQLGGLIKMAEWLATDTLEMFLSQTQEHLVQLITSLDSKNFSGSFALNFVGDVPPSLSKKKKALGIEIKKELKKHLRHVRFVESKESITSSVTVKRNKLLRGADLWFVFRGVDIEIFKTVAVQDYEKFSEHDYGRPRHDAKAGMLPPKLARIMLNLAGVDEWSVVYDPFVGSGTVLQEAIDLGVMHVVGSDIVKKAVQDTNENLAWFAKNVDKKITFNVFTSDIKTVDFPQVKNTTHLVGELDLGAPLTQHATHDQATKYAKEASVLANAAIQLADKLPRLTQCILALPFWYLESGDSTTTTYVAPKKLKQRFIPENWKEIFKKNISPFGGILYRRDNQFIGREIVVFENVQR